MKKSAIVLAIISVIPVLAGPPEQSKPIKNEPPYVTLATPPPVAPEPKFVYGEQFVMGGRPILVTPEQASNVITHFKEAYPKLGNPRLVLYVNRDLVDENSGLRVTSRTEKTEITQNGEKTTHESAYKLSDKPAPTLADKQSIRDVERLFGRPLRMAGANLVDQKVASQMANVTAKDLRGESEQARRDREALAKVADVAIEILVSSRNVGISELSGENNYVVPEIQATAVRLSDARVLGQATAADIVSRLPGSALRTLDVREVSEATALTLMEDMLLNVPQASQP